MPLHPIIRDDYQNIISGIRRVAQKFSGKVILITGGQGFLGSYIVGTLLSLNKQILKKPCKIILIDNGVTSVQSTFRNDNLLLIRRDVSKPIKISGPIDFIMHAAGIASPIYYKKLALETIDVAVLGTKHMLELARRKKIKSFVFFSSSEIYGDPPAEKIPTEETYNGNVSSIGPRACYDESKRLGETYCMTYFRSYKVPIKIIRPFNVFGPGMRTNDFRVIPRFLDSILQNIPLRVYKYGHQTRTFCYITDAIIAILLVLASGSPGEVYNIGNDKNEVSMFDLATMICHITQKKVPIERISYPSNYPQGEPQRRCPDISKMKRELGYHPSVDLRDGITRMLSWCTDTWT